MIINCDFYHHENIYQYIYETLAILIYKKGY